MSENPYRLTNQQARHFLLRTQGLFGPNRFLGKKGVLEYIRRAGCIQFDPVDLCGRNADLTLQSRVKGYRKSMLEALLYSDRALADDFDKCLSIYPAEDWSAFSRYRERMKERTRSREAIEKVVPDVLRFIEEHGPVTSGDLELEEKIHWFWSDTRLSRAVLESLYFWGELGIHHKKGAIKSYDLISRCFGPEILQAPDPRPEEDDHLAWRIERRIGAVGLLWNRASGAFLEIPGLQREKRTELFHKLEEEKRIVAVRVEGLREPLYARVRETPLLEAVLAEKSTRSLRCECLAPLDPLLWDRKLIEKLFGFTYTWEMYVPPEKRKYGAYVLPVLYGDRFLGRIELKCTKNDPRLHVRRFWPEEGIRVTEGMHNALNDCLVRFAAFAECAESPVWDE